MLNKALRGLVLFWPLGRIGGLFLGMISQWGRETTLSKGSRAQAKVQYVMNFEGVVIKPLMAIRNLPIRGVFVGRGYRNTQTKT